MAQIATISLPGRRVTPTVHVKWGNTDIAMGSGHPIVVQSMANTPTADVEQTVAQVLELARAGSELVRLTVNTPEAAKAVAVIRDRLDQAGCSVPLIGDFHYNGHKLLRDVPECARALSKYRINPGNVGKGDAKDEHFCQMVEPPRPVLYRDNTTAHLQPIFFIQGKCRPVCTGISQNLRNACNSIPLLQ